MEKEKLVWKKSKYNLKEIFTSFFKEKESDQILKEARRRQLQETEDKSFHEAELKEASRRGREKATKKTGKAGGIWGSLIQMGSNVNTNMSQSTQKHKKGGSRRGKDPDNLLEGIL